MKMENQATMQADTFRKAVAAETKHLGLWLRMEDNLVAKGSPTKPADQLRDCKWKWGGGAGGRGGEKMETTVLEQ